MNELFWIFSLNSSIHCFCTTSDFTSIRLITYTRTAWLGLKRLIKLSELLIFILLKGYFRLMLWEKAWNKCFLFLYPTLTRCFVVLPLSKVTGTEEWERGTAERHRCALQNIQFCKQLSPKMIDVWLIIEWQHDYPPPQKKTKALGMGFFIHFKIRVYFLLDNEPHRVGIKLHWRWHVQHLSVLMRDCWFMIFLCV